MTKAKHKIKIKYILTCSQCDFSETVGDSMAAILIAREHEQHDKKV